MLTVEVFSSYSFIRFRRRWYFRIKAANHEIIAQSEGYNQRASALQTVIVLQGGMAGAKVKVIEP